MRLLNKVLNLVKNYSTKTYIRDNTMILPEPRIKEDVGSRKFKRKQPSKYYKRLR